MTAVHKIRKFFGWGLIRESGHLFTCVETSGAPNGCVAFKWFVFVEPETADSVRSLVYDNIEALFATSFEATDPRITGAYYGYPFVRH